MATVEQKRVDGSTDRAYEVNYKVANVVKGSVRSFQRVAMAKDAIFARAQVAADLEREYKESGLKFKITSIKEF